MYDGGVTGNKSNAWTIEGTIGVNVSSTGTKLNSSVYGNSYYKANPLLTGDFEVEFTVAEQYKWLQFCFKDSSNTLLSFGHNGEGKWFGWTGSNLGTGVNSSLNTPVVIKIVRENSTYSLYQDGSLIMTRTASVNDCYFNFIEHSDGNRYTTFKNLKIREL